MQARRKCIIILSSKSSGSSALQNLLVKLPHVNNVLKTRHFENETLYWTKAASILSLRQVDMLDSEVPLNKKKARADLINLLCDNINAYKVPSDNYDLIFGGWMLLCEKYSPVFLEKSPHHLYQWSALELIANCIERLPKVDFLLIGLVRNPMDTLYSMWKRWGNIPEKHQYEWISAYKNLLKYKEIIGDKLIIIRYEDITHNRLYLKQVYKFIGISANYYNNSFFHSMSIQKWKKDRNYGFKLSEYVVRLAEKFGYNRSEMTNDHKLFWPFYRYMRRFAHLSIKPTKSMIRSLLKQIHILK